MIADRRLCIDIDRRDGDPSEDPKKRVEESGRSMPLAY